MFPPSINTLREILSIHVTSFNSRVSLLVGEFSCVELSIAATETCFETEELDSLMCSTLLVDI